MHLFPNNKIPYAESDQGIITAISNLKADMNYSDLMVTMIGAINRAIAQITLYGLTEKKRVDLSCVSWEMCCGTYQTPINSKEIFSIEYGDKPCEIIENYLVALGEEKPKYIIYKAKHPEITQLSSDLMGLELDDVLCHLIPLYVKGELYTLDNEEKREASQEFKDSLTRYKEKSTIALPQEAELIYKEA